MINHARTLLLNLLADSGPAIADRYGEEIVDPNFRPLTLSASLAAVRAAIFGGSPDRYYLNFRIAQCMALLHSTELVEYLTALDSRITYDLSGDVRFLVDAWKPVATQQDAGDIRRVFFVDAAIADEGLGRIYHEWSVAVLNSTQVSVVRTTFPFDALTQDYTTESNVSSLITLPGADLKIRFETGSDSVWTIKVAAGPPSTLGQIAAKLRNIKTTDLFGTRVEPYRTFANLWSQHSQLPYRLGGLLLALIYRTDELRGA